MLDIWPHPQPASRVIPEEYKKLKRFTDGNLHLPTVKTCMPFLDSMSMGYIIPFDQDYLVDPVENDFSVTPANKEEGNFGVKLIGYRKNLDESNSTWETCDLVQANPTSNKVVG